MRIAWIINYGRWNFIFYLDFIKNDLFILIISLFIVLASFTKSAQIPFSSWLPAAMAAPTPVSSLVHSRTLVTAGVYLLIRFSNCLNRFLIFFVLFISSLTMFISGLGANFEFDLKKIIALSTLSQLGLIIRVIFLGDSKLAFFHLLTHALFKALLFMCAGNIIHNLINCQDIRFIGSLLYQIPLTCSFFCISNLSLCGLPFLSGFYSKDLILESFSMSYFNIYIYIIFYFSTGLTVSYTIRLIYYTIFGNFNFFSLNNLCDYNETMTKGMLGLFVFVIFRGSLLNWLIVDNLYFIVIPFFIKIRTLFVILIGAIFGFEISKFSINYSLKSFLNLKLTYFLSNIWNIPYIFTFGVNNFPLRLGFGYYSIFDHGWEEYFGRQGLFNRLTNTSLFLQVLFNNNIKIFLILIVFWLLILIFILYLNSLFRA